MRLLRRVSMDFFEVGSQQPAVTNHDATGYPDVAHPVAVADDEVGGTARTQGCQRKTEAFRSEPKAAPSPGLDDGRRLAVFGRFGPQDPNLVLHLGRVTVGSDRHPGAFAEGRGVTDTVAPVRAWVLHDPQVPVGNGSHLSRLAVNAVSQDRTARQGAEVVQALEGPVVAPVERIFDVGQILGHMNVHHGLEIATQVGSLFDRPVRDCERGVQPDDPANEVPIVGPMEPATLPEPAPCLVATAIALGGPEAEKGPYAELLTGVGQDVE